LHVKEICISATRCIPYPESPGSTSLIATFRDPAGNLIGLYQEEP